MIRFTVESSGLAAARMLYGDEAVANYVFEKEYDAEFVDRHPHQLAGLWGAYVDGYE